MALIHRWNVPETTSSTEPGPTLSKLQKLSLANQAEQSNAPKSLASLARAAQIQRSPPLGTPESPKQPEPTVPTGRAPSKLALLASKGKAASTTTPKPASSTTGLSKIAQKVQASRMASLNPEPRSSQVSDVLPSWVIDGKERGDALKAVKPSHFASILTSSNGGNVVSMRQGGGANKKDVSIPVFNSAFKFDTPSPDELVLQARRGTSLAQRSLPSQ